METSTGIIDYGKKGCIVGQKCKNNKEVILGKGGCEYHLRILILNDSGIQRLLMKISEDGALEKLRASSQHKRWKLARPGECPRWIRTQNVIKASQL
jgi:hypothetical protein